MASELRIGSARYKMTEKMDAFKQMALISKVSPILASGIGEIAPLITELRREGLAMDNLPMERLGQIITPVSRELAAMTEEDRRFVVGTCLSQLSREDEGRPGWAPVWNPDAGRSNYEDLNSDLVSTLRLVLLVIQDTFGNFLPAGLSTLNPGARH